MNDPIARVQRNVQIPMADGVVLSGNLWLPDLTDRVPALIRFTAYRKDDLEASSEVADVFFADHRYASLLVDLRGLGASSGIPDEAISPREASDGAHVVEWAAQQSWCDGNVGIWGMSWGATTAFRVAAERPPHLRAAVAAMGFLDAYRDWLYPGGCPTCLVPSTWACQHLLQQLMPPIVGDERGRWFERWMVRLDHIRPYLVPWLEHPRDDGFWRRLAIDPTGIEVPMFLIGGWRDMCCAGTIRAYQQIDAPKRLLIGPWGHTLPDAAAEQPMNYLPELRRWWDHWLKEPNGCMSDRSVMLFTQRRATWRREANWPVEPVRTLTWWLEDAGLVTASRTRGNTSAYRCDPTVGTASGRWDSLGTPIDQSADDARSLSYDSPPLCAELEITGAPAARVTVSVQGGAEVVLVIRLCDVAPDGRSDLITSGWRKLPQADEAARPVDVPLWPTSYAVPASHRVRVSVSCADFPHLWPTPTNPLIRVHGGIEGGSSIELPVPTAASPEAEVVVAPARERSASDLVLSSSRRRTFEHDLIGGGIAVISGSAAALTTPTLAGPVKMQFESTARVEPSRPDAAHVDSRASASLTTPTGNRVHIEARTRTSRGRLSMWGCVEIEGTRLFECTWRSGRWAIRGNGTAAFRAWWRRRSVGGSVV